jgi:hypothetical protein
VSDLNAATLASIYIKMRNEIKALDDKAKEIKEKQDLIANTLLELCNAEDANTISTPEGTISRRLQSSYWTSDWGSFYQFVGEHDAYHLLEKRIHNGNMKEFLSMNKDSVPMGLQSKQHYVISVRKPTSKVGDNDE